MKKYLVLLLAAALLACSACGKKQVVQSGTLGGGVGHRLHSGAGV